MEFSPWDSEKDDLLRKVMLAAMKENGLTMSRVTMMLKMTGITLNRFLLRGGRISPLTRGRIIKFLEDPDNPAFPKKIILRS